MYKPMTVMRGQINARIVDAPALPRGDKGRTKYDEWFDQLFENRNKAIQVPQDDMERVKKAAFRYIGFKNMKGKLTVRQKKDETTRTFMLWFIPVEAE